MNKELLVKASTEILKEIDNAIWRMYINLNISSDDARFLESILNPIKQELSKREQGIKKKVYIASSFQLTEKVIEVSQILWKHGIEVTQAWWKVDYKKIPLSGETWYNHPDVIAISKKNFDAIDEADAVLLVCPDDLPIRFNGANIEVGYAIAKGKPVYSIGKLQRSAMYVPVKRLNTIDDFLKEVKK